MTLFAVLATGPSMSRALCDYVMGQCPAVAVSNAYALAPWAAALVSHDARWWRHNPEALKFAGAKFCGNGKPEGTEKFFHPRMSRPCNSGLMGMYAARMLGATSIALLGFDMHGDHFFGRHPAPLTNTTDKKRRLHLAQFTKWRECPVFNCTPGSQLTAFPFADIEEVIRHGSGQAGPADRAEIAERGE